MTPFPVLEPSTYVPTRFSLAIASHIVKNVVDLGIDTPLILGIHGPPGEGKTRQCELVLQTMGVAFIPVSGGELEHPRAGRPGELLRDRYREASSRSKPDAGAICALLINDFDTGAAVWGNQGGNTIFQYTTNPQNVYSTLMNFADHPTIVDNQPTHRIPILLTGNDFSKLYEPLTRPGRMTKFYWSPTVEEKSFVTSRMFMRLHLPEHLFREFFARYSERPVSFFADVMHTLIDDDITKWTLETGIDRVVHCSQQIRPDNWWNNRTYTLEDLSRSAAKVATEHDKMLSPSALRGDGR